LRAQNLPALTTMHGEKILIRGVNWLGDAIMTLPALHRLREAKPKARITLLTPEKLASLWTDQIVIDSVIAFAPSATVTETGKRLRAERFDVAIAFPNSVRSALELWLARIPMRIGLARRGRSLFLTDALAARSEAVVMHKNTDAEVRESIAAGKSTAAIPAPAHHVYDYLYLTSRLGATREPVPPSLRVSAARVAEVSAKFGVNDGLWLGLNPGAEYGPAKRWPVERFIESARLLSKETSCRWLIFGGPGDTELTENVTKEIRAESINLAGKTSLADSAALFTRCRAVLTNDTGPMHLADAVGTPVVVPFGSTSPELTGPIFSSRARILRNPPPCAPCFRRECPIDLRCLTGITTEQAVGAVREIIAGKRQTS
jgi:heptosyltransferase-2